MVKFYIGVDISKDTLDIHVKSIDNQFNHHVQISNSSDGFNELDARLKDLKINVLQSYFCAEHTGRYGLLMQTELEARGWQYSLVPANEIIRSIGVQRGKNDRVDAQRIAEYACRYWDKLSPTRLPEKVLADLKELFVIRAFLVKQRAQIKNSMKKKMLPISKQVAKHLSKVHEQQLNDLNKKITETEALIDEVILQDEEVQNNFKLLVTVIGIGRITATYLICITSNFKNFDSARKLASYPGLAPFENKSGSSLNRPSRVSKFRNKKLKTLLTNGVNTAIQHDPEIKAYYLRKIEEGKHKKQAKNAVANKIVARAFAVVKRKSPFVKTYAQSFSQSA